MRDRRLLLPALALLIALIAVPLLLKDSSSSSTTAPAAVASTGTGGDSAATPAVLARQVGITDYRRRLDSFQSKNPFRSRIAAPKDASQAAGSSGTSAPGVTTTDTTTTDTTTTDTTTTSPGSDSSSTVTSTTSTTSPGSGSSNAAAGGSGGTPAQSHSTIKWYSFRVSVSVGPAGDLTRRDNVRRMVFLPGESRPLAAFIGVSEDAKQAIFVVSDDVSEVSGGGTCFPRRSSCNFLQLKPGDKASLEYAPEGGRRYNLKLHEIKLIPISKPHAAASNKSGVEPVLGPEG
jgi:hypothetical protein